MPKLVKNVYYGKNGEKKVNCYHLSIPKSVIKESEISEDAQLVFSTSKGEIRITQCEN